ncbi:MAG: phytoene dehydrogenase [Deltaproteobacteria bacterium]|nr:phytoene dehydrogenase [Deltaproteobacteria bacterium]
MSDRYYDVVVLGRSLGALVAAALLARRELTVLVLGQGKLPAQYQFEGTTLRRRAFTMLAGGSPAWRRVLAELAQTQLWRRRSRLVEPVLQVIMPGRRFEISGDRELFGRAVEREFPEARRLVAGLYAELGRVRAAADAAFDREALWPPGTFLERRETGRLAATLPYARAEPHADLLAEFPRAHPYRRIVAESIRFATDLASPPPAFAVARLHGSWASGPCALGGGEQELEQLLLDRIAVHGGRHLMGERAVRLDVRRGAACGARIDGDAGTVGTGFVISDLTGEEVAALGGGEGISERAQREWPRIRSPVARVVVSVAVRRAGVPAPLGPETLMLSPVAGEDGAAPAIHLQRVDISGTDQVLLVAELLLGERGPLRLRDVRQHVVARLCAALPFLERHLLLADCVHDGLPLWRYGPAAAGPELVERVAVTGTSARAEPAERQIEVDPPGYLGLAGEPIRGPIERTLLVGPSVLPGLGQEGRLLAALGVARLVTRSDRRKARMRRETWTKIDIG